jgi:hypothetical protein
MRTKKNIVIVIALALVGTWNSPAIAQEKGGADLRAAVQNPVGAMYSLPFKFTFDYGAPNGEASFLNIQPVIPITVGDWNYINRIIAPLVDTPGQVTGTPGIPNPPPGDGATGLGDINYSLFVSPAKPKGFIWGLGPSIMLPTASDAQLGSEKWSAGPTGVVLVQPKWGTYGGLVRHLWSFAGEDDRASVNQTLFEPFLNYNLDKGWYLITDLIILANWQADSSNRWTVPLGGGVGKLLKIGNQAINVRTEAYYNVAKPDSAPNWQWGFTIQFLFPK